MRPALCSEAVPVLPFQPAVWTRICRNLRSAVQIHCGSRGLGHQICEDYVSRFQKTAQDYGIALPDRELVCVPLDSEEGQEYFRAKRM
jgi:RNA-splicing ligase RtcB